MIGPLERWEDNKLWAEERRLETTEDEIEALENAKAEAEDAAYDNWRDEQ